MASSTSLLLLSLFLLFSSSSQQEESRPLTITLPLTPTFTIKPSPDPIVFLQELASASMARAHLLKYGKPSPQLKLKTPLYPRGYGGHSIPLSFGTPPQKLSYLVDTGSDVVWAPCTKQYKCINCSFSSIPIFKPELSSSSTTLGCKNPRCTTGCPTCKPNSRNCSRDCPMSVQYGIGAAAGHYLLEDLHFPGKTIRNFLLGCATISARESSTDAMAGFGLSPASLPKQLGVKKFAYCLKSHYFDNTRNSSSLTFDYRDGDTEGLSYAPFLKNPTDWPIYYYLGVKGMTLGNKLLPIPGKYLAPGSGGSGGVIIDSGFTNGYMAGPVFKIVTDELKRQMSKYRRSREVEEIANYTPCYNFTGHKTLKIPNLSYHFNGGATMVVPGKRYFRFIPGVPFGCFPVTTDGGKALEFTPGPAIIVGNYMQVNHYIEFDLKKDRLGFRQQKC